jgi:hypothetical protein
MAIGTNKPIGSTDPRDLLANAENIDNFANGQATGYPDRFGIPRKSIKGIEVQASELISGIETEAATRITQAIINSGYQYLGDYASGITVSEANQMVKYDGEFWKPSASTVLPFTTTNWGADAGKFVGVGDAVLRSELALLNSEVLIAGEKSSSIARSVKFIVNVEDFRQASITDTATVISAFNSAPNRSCVKFERGRHYILNQRILVDLTTRSIAVDFNGSIVEFTDGQDGFTFRSDWAISTFSSVSANGEVIEGIGNTSLFRPKDYVRILSDDVAPDARSNVRQCEDIYAESIGANSITLQTKSGVFYETQSPYVTNPRIAQRSGNTVTIFAEDSDVRHSQSATFAGWQSRRLVECSGLMFPHVYGLSSSMALAPTVEFQACIGSVLFGGYDGRKDDISVSGDKNTYGYGVIDCSYQTKIFGRHAFRVRHAIDTHHQAFGTNQPPERYGSSVGLRAIGCTATATSNTAFTTHHGCRDVKYIGCTAYEVPFPHYGYGLRGEVDLVDCASVRCGGDWLVFDEDNASPSRTKVNIYNHTSDSTYPARNVNRITPVNVYNWIAKNAHYRNTLLYTANYDDAHLKLHGKTIIKPGPIAFTGNALIGNTVKGLIEFDHIEFDVKRTFYNYAPLINCQGSSAATNFYSLKGGVMRIIGAGVNRFITGSPSHPINPNQLNFTAVFDDNTVTWEGGDQNNPDKIRAAFDNNLSYLGKILVLESPDHQYGLMMGYKRDVNLSFGSVGPSARAFTDFFVNGFALNTPAFIYCETQDTRVIVEKCIMIADRLARVYVQNRSGATENLDNIDFTVVASKI